jgi:acylphosphatase
MNFVSGTCITFLTFYCMVTQRLTIRGRVQGVGYRDALCREAERHGVAGWVRNRTDGSVEALVRGEAEDVAALVAWARRGPPAARVDQVHTATAEDPELPLRFQIRPTV